MSLEKSPIDFVPFFVAGAAAARARPSRYANVRRCGPFRAEEER
jgi:hypothetical protein